MMYKNLSWHHSDGWGHPHRKGPWVCPKHLRLHSVVTILLTNDLRTQRIEYSSDDHITTHTHTQFIDLSQSQFIIMQSYTQVQRVTLRSMSRCQHCLRFSMTEPRVPSGTIEIIQETSFTLSIIYIILTVISKWLHSIPAFVYMLFRYQSELKIRLERARRSQRYTVCSFVQKIINTCYEHTMSIVRSAF